MVVDELGFHQATSTAELLADRGCQVEIVTNGMVVAQDLGVTLDMETWNVKAHAKGIGQSVDLVPMAVRPDDGVRRGVDRSRRRRAQPAAPPDRHRPGAPCDWVVCSVHQQPEDELWRDLRDGPFPVHRIGDCLAPRRAHAAVIEGHRVAVSL